MLLISLEIIPHMLIFQFITSLATFLLSFLQLLYNILLCGVRIGQISLKELKQKHLRGFCWKMSNSLVKIFTYARIMWLKRNTNIVCESIFEHDKEHQRNFNNAKVLVAILIKALTSSMFNHAFFVNARNKNICKSQNEHKSATEIFITGNNGTDEEANAHRQQLIETSNHVLKCFNCCIPNKSCGCKPHKIFKLLYDADTPNRRV